MLTQSKMVIEAMHRYLYVQIIRFRSVVLFAGLYCRLILVIVSSILAVCLRYGNRVLVEMCLIVKNCFLINTIRIQLLSSDLIAKHRYREKDGAYNRAFKSDH